MWSFRNQKSQKRTYKLNLQDPLESSYGASKTIDPDEIDSTLTKFAEEMFDIALRKAKGQAVESVISVSIPSNSLVKNNINEFVYKVLIYANEYGLEYNRHLYSQDSINLIKIGEPLPLGHKDSEPTAALLHNPCNKTKNLSVDEYVELVVNIILQDAAGHTGGESFSHILIDIPDGIMPSELRRQVIYQLQLSNIRCTPSEHEVDTIEALGIGNDDGP